MTPAKTQPKPGKAKPKASQAPVRAKKPPAKPVTPVRRKPDWQAIERDYRTGKFTFRELEAKHGPSNTTISRRAKRDGWAPDLTEAVRQATNAALIGSMLQQGCSAAQQDASTAVLAAAELNRQVITGHRQNIAQAAGLVRGLMDDLGFLGRDADSLERLAEIAGGEDPSKALEAIRRATSVHARASSVKTLADAVDKLMRAERVAFGLDRDDGKPPVESAPADKYTLTDDDLLAIAAGRSR